MKLCALLFLIICPFCIIAEDLPKGVERALDKYNKAIDKAKDEYRKSEDEAKEGLIKTLNKEVKNAGKKGDIELAVKIKNIINELSGKESLDAGDSNSVIGDSGKEQVYYGMVGKYTNANGPIPFILLSQPTESAKALNNGYSDFLNGKLDRSIGMRVFKAYGYVNVPSDGKYLIKAGRATTIKIDSIGYDLSNYGSPNGKELELKKGVRRIDLDVGNNGGQLGGAFVDIKTEGGKRELKLFIFESDLAVLEEEISGEKVKEISGWSKRKNIIKGAKVSKP